MSFREKWSYGGIETSINGLTLWLEKNFDYKGNANNRYNEQCKLIVKYGEENIEGFKQRGSYRSAAIFVAKKISEKKLFQHFTEWAKREINQRLQNS